MATNNRWENFKLSNPVIGDRYNRTQATGWQQGNLAQAQKNFVTDPWFSLGHTIGSAWADNYNDRGISKGRAEMQDALNGYLGQFGTQQQDGVNYNPNMIKGEDAGMGSKYITQADGTQPNGVLGQTSMYFDANGNFNAQQPDLAGGKLSYRYNKYLNSDNPDSEAMQNKGDIQSMNQMGNNIDFGKVDKEQAREYVRQQLESKGRTPYQIEQVLGQFDSIYDSKYGKWQENKATNLIEIGQKALKDGRWDDAQNAFVAASQYNPKMGSLQLQAMQQSYNRKYQAQQQRDKEFMAGYMRDENGNLVINPNHPIWSTKKYGGVGGGRASSGGTTKSGTLADYGTGRWIGRKDAVTHQEHADALAFLKYADGLEELKPEQKVAYNHAMDVVNKYNSQNHGGVRGYNIDSPDDVANYIRGVAYNMKNNPNVSGTDILNTLRNDGIMVSPYWDDKYLELLGLSADGTNEE